MSLGQWENSASLVRVRELGAALLKKGIRVSYLVDDAWSIATSKSSPKDRTLNGSSRRRPETIRARRANPAPSETRLRPRSESPPRPT